MAATESVTILFTDLVGSTELSQTLSPAEADQVRRAHFATLRKAVASSEGTEVKNLGDGIMVAFSASSTAVSCAVAMQQAVEAQNRNNGHSLGLRVGLSGGEVTKESTDDGDDYFGDPVVEAARLCARAEGGQVLASRFVQIMAGRRTPHAFTPVGPLELKGLTQPLETVEVGWEPLAETGGGTTVDEVPLPRRLGHRPGPGVIGRHLHLVTVEEAYKRVASHQGREVVLIAGEAGQGKTTLAAEAARRAHAEGAVVLLGRCDEELGVPYAPFAEALNHYVSHAPEELLTAHVATHGAELSRLSRALRSRVEGLAAPSEGADAETERYVLYAAVLGLLTAACEEHPVVLVLDDLQWADVASLQLLRHLVKEADPLQLLILGTYRDTELSPTHPLTETLGALRREPGVGRISLKGLDDNEVVQYLEAAAGHDLSKEGLDLAHAVYGETDGNPFFVSEMLRHLTESGAVYKDQAGRWAATTEAITLPNSVREVVATRVGRLGEQSTRVLSVAAVIGRDFELTHLSRVTNRDEEELLDLLDAATDAAVVREVPEVPGRYTFSHALVQHTLYQELGATRRARVHRQVAEALEDLCGDHPEARVGELAHHWFHATQLVDTKKAISYSRQAGESALAALAPADAVRYFNQAIQLLDQVPGADPALAVDLRLDLGTAQRQAGIPAFRETFLDAAHRAQDLGASDRLVKAALGNNRGFFSALGVVDEEKVSVLESALDSAPPGDGTDRAVLLATLCSELAYGPLDRRLELARESTEMARRLGDPATLIDVLNLQQLPLNIPSTLADRLPNSARAVSLAEELNEPVRLFWAMHFDRNNAIQGGDFERASHHLGVMKGLSERLRQPMMVWVTTYHEAVEALVVGDHERAERLATLALEIGADSEQPDAFAFYGAQLMIVRIQQGRLAELADLVRDIAEQNPRIAAYQACRMLTHLDAGEDAEALALLEEAAVDGFTWVFPDTAWFDAISIYARASIELEARRPAEHLVPLIAPHHEQVPFQGLTVHEPMSCFVGGLLAMLGRDEEADTYLSEAAAICERGGMRFARAQTDLSWGRMLARRSAAEDRQRARTMLERAHDTAVANGYRAIERRAARTLEALQPTDSAGD
jgi:class 3 adenylate cyclase